MQTQISQPEGKRKMPETRFTEFAELSVDPRVGISPSASDIDVCLFFLLMTVKSVKSHSLFLLFITFYVA